MGLTQRSLLLLVLTSILLGAISKPTKKYRYDADFLDSEIQRIRSGKASEIDPIWTPNNSGDETKAEEISHTGSAESKNKTSVEVGNEDKSGSASESSSSEDYYGSSEEIDITCAPDKGWHIRGQRCVPINCPGGPAERDFNTGECLYAPSSSRGRYNKPFQQWNDLKYSSHFGGSSHVYRSSPMSTHFVRSMILMRKG